MHHPVVKQNQGLGVRCTLFYFFVEAPRVPGDRALRNEDFMYQIRAEQSFDAAHFLAGYVGKCGNIHGHRWRVEVCIAAPSLLTDAQNRGMITDFARLKQELLEDTEVFDHTFIYEEGTLKEELLSLLEAEGFVLSKVGFRPTAENFARYFYERMKERGYCVAQAAVYETPNNCARYQE